jgi:hypothetical protein
MVIPRSRSAFSLSRTHAYLKEPLPNSAASCKMNQQLNKRNLCDVEVKWMVGQQPTLVVVPKLSGREILLIVGSESLPHRGAKNRDKVEICVQRQQRCGILTFSNFSMVRLSIPPHL